MKVYVTGGSGFIGTHLITRLAEELPRTEIRNFDIIPPPLAIHKQFWSPGDIRSPMELQKDLCSFSPTHVVHLAARTDTNARTLQDYWVNTGGSANLIASLNKCESLERVVFVSTQYVVRPGQHVANVREYNPHTVYGASKCLMEQMVWQSGLSCSWVIARPTNIWGSWHPRYPHEFWRVLRQGRYLHPGGRPVFRAYGYVGNVVDQIWKLLISPRALVDRKVFYLGDPVDDIATWVTAFSFALCGRPPRIVPRPLLRTLALFGDVAGFMGYPFPLFSSRYRSMTQDYIVDMEPTFAALGPPRYTLEEGVEATIEWLETQGPEWALRNRRQQSHAVRGAA